MPLHKGFKKGKTRAKEQALVTTSRSQLPQKLQSLLLSVFILHLHVRTLHKPVDSSLCASAH